MAGRPHHPSSARAAGTAAGASEAQGGRIQLTCMHPWAVCMSCTVRQACWACALHHDWDDLCGWYICSYWIWSGKMSVLTLGGSQLLFCRGPSRHLGGTSTAQADKSPPPNMTLCIIVVLGYPARLHFNVSIVVTVRGSSSWLVLVSSQCTRLLSVSADAQAAAAGCSRHRPIGNSCDAPLFICSALNSTFTC